MIFVGVIFVFILFLFLLDKKDEVNKVQRQGGVEIKYGILLNHFSTIPRMRIERRSNTSITMAVKDPNVVTRFTVSHGFDDVSIYWEHRSITFGRHNLNWKFPEYKDQNSMIAIIENELGAYQMKLMGGF